MNALPFVIWCNQRSGSTHLSSLLASHPNIACWRELFFAGEGDAKDDYFTRSHIRDLAEFLDRFFSHDWQPINLVEARPIVGEPGAVGFKLKYQQAERYPRLVSYLSSRRETLKVIHLIRKNLLATLVSSLILPAVFAKFSDANVLAEVMADNFQPSVRIVPQNLYSELEALDAVIDRARDCVADFNVMEVVYEDLITKPSAELNQLLMFLGVDSQPVLSSRYRKILPLSPLHSISNGDDVKAVLKGTRFESFLSDRCDHG
jgi:hypothetical protein